MHFAIIKIIQNSVILKNNIYFLNNFVSYLLFDTLFKTKYSVLPPVLTSPTKQLKQARKLPTTKQQ
jgi:hypothetical protein